MKNKRNNYYKFYEAFYYLNGISKIMTIFMIVLFILCFTFAFFAYKECFVFWEEAYQGINLIEGHPVMCRIIIVEAVLAFIFSVVMVGTDECIKKIEY